MAQLKRMLYLRDIVLMNIVAIVVLRWLLTAAQQGLKFSIGLDFLTAGRDHRSRAL